MTVIIVLTTNTPPSRYSNVQNRFVIIVSKLTAIDANAQKATTSTGSTRTVGMPMSTVIIALNFSHALNDPRGDSQYSRHSSL